MIFNVLQIIGGLTLTFGWFPQIYQIIKTKSVRDLNLGSNMIIFIGVLLMEAYAINLVILGAGIAFLITNTLSLLVAFTMVCLVMYYGKDEKLNIIVNGKPQVTVLKTMSYEQLIELIGGNPKEVYSATFSVRFEDGWHKQGMLSFGQSVDLYNNMVFNAYITNNA